MANSTEYDVIINVITGHLEKATKQLRGMAGEIDNVTSSNKRGSKAQDEVNYKLNQGTIGASSAARSFSKLNQAIGNGPNGLVGAYATLAANAFAVSAAFNQLRSAAQVEQMMKGLETQGARTGKNLKGLSQDLQELTNYSISAADAMQATALMSSAGFTSKGMRDLTTVANNAALALGRNVPDALDRISKGVTKLEPELLDELGIMTKLTEAQSAYALANNKSVNALSSFEKRQAMLNAVVAEGTAKFGGLSEQVGANPYDQLAATFSNLTKSTLGFLNTILGPVASIFGSNQGMLLGGIILFVSTIRKQLMPALFEMSKNSRLAAESHAKEAEEIRDKAKANLELAKSANAASLAEARAKAGTIAGAAAPKKFRSQEIQSGSLNEIELQKELNRLKTSERGIQASIDGTGFKVAQDKVALQQTKLKLIQDEIKNLEKLIKLETSGESQLQVLRKDARNTKLLAIREQKLASMETLKAEAIEAAYAGNIRESWKKAKEAAEEYKKSVKAEGLRNRLQEDGSIKPEGRIGKLLESAKGSLGSVGIFASTISAGVMKFLPYIGVATTALSGAWSVYQNFIKSDAAKAHTEALKKLKETLDNTAKSVKELNRLNESSIPLSLKAAQTLTIQSNATAEIASAFKEVEKAAAKQASSVEVDSFFEAFTGSKQDTTQYLTGIKDPTLLKAATEEFEKGWGPSIGAALGAGLGAGLGLFFTGGALTPYLALGGTLIGERLGRFAAEYLPEELNGIDEAAMESLRAVDQLSRVLDKNLVDSMVKAAGGMEELANNPAMRSAFIRQAADAYVGVADAVKSLQEGFKAVGDAATKFFRSAIPSTAFDDILTGFTSVNKSFKELDRTLGGSKATEQIKLLSGMPEEMIRLLEAPQQQLLTTLKQQALQITYNNEQIKQLKELGNNISNEDRNRLKILESQNVELNRQMESRSGDLDGIKASLRATEDTFRANQRTSREYDSQLKLINAIASMNAEVYSKTAEGEKARIDRHNQAVRLQQAQLELQINITKTYIQQTEAVVKQLEAQQLQLKITKQMDTATMQAAERQRKAERAAAESAALKQVDGKSLVSATTLRDIDRIIAGWANNKDAANKLQTGKIDLKGLTGAALEAAQAYVEAARQAEIAGLAVSNALSIEDNKNQIEDFKQNIKSLQTNVAALQTTIIGPAQAIARINAKRDEYARNVAKTELEIKQLAEENVETAKTSLILERGRANAIRDSIRAKIFEAEKTKTNIRTESGDRIAALKAERDIIQAKLKDHKEISGVDKEAYTSYISSINKQIEQEEKLNTLRQQSVVLKTKQQILETIIGGGLEESISKLQESIDLRERELQLTASLADKQLEIAQNRSKIAIARVGGKVDERTQKAFEVESAERAYKSALQLDQIRKNAINAEYDLLSAKRDLEVQGLKTQLYLLRVYDQIFNNGKNSSEIDKIMTNVNEATSAMMKVDFTAMRKAALDSQAADLTILEQRRDLARAEYENLDVRGSGILGLVENWKAEFSAIDRADKIASEKVATETKAGAIDLSDQVSANKAIVAQLVDANISLSSIEKAIVPSVDQLLSAPTTSAATTRTADFIDPSTIVSGIDWSKMNESFITKYGNMLGAFFKDNPNSPFRQGVAGTSGRRTQEDQDRIWNAGVWRNGKRVTKAGEPIARTVGFGHGTGEATDQSRDFVAALAKWGKGSQFGLEVGTANGQVDKVHIQALRDATSSAVVQGAAAAAPEVKAAIAEGTQSGVVAGTDAASQKVREAKIVSAEKAGAGAASSEEATKAAKTAANANDDLSNSNDKVANSGKKAEEQTKRQADALNLFITNIPKAMQMVEQVMSELGTAMTERLGQDFGPQGKIMLGLTGLTTLLSIKLPATLTTLKTNFDDWLKNQSEGVKKLDADTQQSIYQAERLAAAFSAAAQVIGAVAGLIKSISDAKIAATDKEIAAEEKKDGKSAASVAKIDALEKKKDAMARKSFNTQKKLMLAQAVMSTAAAVASTWATMVPVAGPIVAGIMAGIVGAAGLAQIAIISSTQYESSYSPKTASMPSTLSIGKRSDTVDLAQGPNANAGGEAGYLRGSAGTGTNASNYRTIGSAYGGELMRGYGNRGFVVGEKGPEIITPETPITVTPANDVGQSQAINANISIQALDSQGVQDVLVSQKGNIIKMLRQAANASGKTFMEDVNVNVYTRPSVGKL